MIFSVIIPVYNVEKFLRQCIDSVLAQTFLDYQVLLIDDGSTDSSGTICDEYSEKYAFIKTIHQQNQGLSGARNSGLDHAVGEWIVFLDSDDWVETNMFEVLNKHIQSENIDMVSFNLKLVYEDNTKNKNLIFNAENGIEHINHEWKKFIYYFERLMQCEDGWEVCGRVFKCDIIKSNNLKFVSTEKVFAEDYLFTFTYLMYTNRISKLCNVFYNYRQRPGSLMQTCDSKTILPRLVNWAEEGYKMAKNAKMKLVCRQYYKLYFMLLNHHIQYGDFDESVQTQIDRLQINKNHRKWLKQIEKNSSEFEKYMERVKWLKR